MKKIVSGIILLLYCILGMVPMAWADASPQKIMVITVDNAVESGLASYLERNVAAAKEKHVDILILELDTPGGRVDGSARY